MPQSRLPYSLPHPSPIPTILTQVATWARSFLKQAAHKDAFVDNEANVVNVRWLTSLQICSISFNALEALVVGWCAWKMGHSVECYCYWHHWFISVLAMCWAIMYACVYVEGIAAYETRHLSVIDSLRIHAIVLGCLAQSFLLCNTHVPATEEHCPTSIQP